MNSRSVKVAFIAVWLGSSGALAVGARNGLRGAAEDRRRGAGGGALRIAPLGAPFVRPRLRQLLGARPEALTATARISAASRTFPNSRCRWGQLNANILRRLPDARRVTPRSRSPRAPGRWADFRVGRLLILSHEAGYANRAERYVAIHIERAEEDSSADAREPARQARGAGSLQADRSDPISISTIDAGREAGRVSATVAAIPTDRTTIRDFSRPIGRTSALQAARRAFDRGRGDDPCDFPSSHRQFVRRPHRISRKIRSTRIRMSSSRTSHIRGAPPGDGCGSGSPPS